MAVNKCNITDVSKTIINEMKYGLKCTPFSRILLENYLQYLDCATVTFTPCYPDTCVNAPVPIAFTAIYWGFEDTDDVLSVDDIEASPYHSNVMPGSPIVTSYRTNHVPKYLWVAIGVAHPIVTSWYGQPFNQGSIGTNQDFMKAAVLVSSKYNFYISNYKSQQEETDIEFRP